MDRRGLMRKEKRQKNAAQDGSVRYWKASRGEEGVSMKSKSTAQTG
jgi:hypothetical protein